MVCIANCGIFKLGVLLTKKGNAIFCDVRGNDLFGGTGLFYFP